MSRQIWKPGNMLYPVPAVMVTVGDENESNIITIAWTGTVNSDPAMVSVSVRKSRFSYDLLMKQKEFVINLVTKKLTHAMDYCGVKSGRDVDKFKETKLTRGNASKVKAPIIEESPVNIECVVKQVIPLGSHDMFLAEVVAVDVDDKYMDEGGRFNLDKVGLVAYSHGRYYSLGENLGKFGYSVRKKTGKNHKKPAK